MCIVPQSYFYRHSYKDPDNPTGDYWVAFGLDITSMCPNSPEWAGIRIRLSPVDILVELFDGLAFEECGGDHARVVIVRLMEVYPPPERLAMNDDFKNISIKWGIDPGLLSRLIVYKIREVQRMYARLMRIYDMYLYQ